MCATPPSRISVPALRGLCSRARPPGNGLPLAQRGAHVHQHVAIYGHRGEIPARIDPYRHLARKDEQTRQPGKRLLGWRQVGWPGSHHLKDEATVRIHGYCRGPGHVRGDALSVSRVREGNLRGAGEQEDRRPVDGLEHLAEDVVDVLRCVDQEPAVRGVEARAEVLERPAVPPPPGEGRRGRHDPSEHAQQRAERHDYSKSPHGHPPLARGRAEHYTPGHFPIMVMHPLCSTVPSEPSTRRRRSKGTVSPLPRPPRSNSTAPAPPADVVSVATGTKSVLVQTPSAASTARVMVKVVFGAASWMLTLTWASKSPCPSLVGETMTRPVPCPVTAVRALMAPVGPACAAGAAIMAAQAANRPTASPRNPDVRIMTSPTLSSTDHRLSNCRRRTRSAEPGAGPWLPYPGRAGGLGVRDLVSDDSGALCSPRWLGRALAGCLLDVGSC